MIRRYLMWAAVLALAACADAPTAVQDRAAPEGGPLLSTSTVWNIFTTQTPGFTGNASPGWEVATRFYTTQEGCVTGLRFWRASGETGTNTVRLWTYTGTQLGSGSVSSGSGWQYVYFSGFACLDTYTYYIVSVNTNTRQAKTSNAFGGSQIVNGPLVADGGYYGQPMGTMPGTPSSSNFFVDVVFDTGFTF
jgi:hypothetical protein